MYGKEASNRKQEIDRQYHTIPTQRPKDKHYGKIQKFWFFHNADYYGISLIPYIFLIVNIEFVKDKCYNTPVQIRQNERGELMRTNKKRKNEVQLHAKPVEATFAWSNNSR